MDHIHRSLGGRTGAAWPCGILNRGPIFLGGVVYLLLGNREEAPILLAFACLSVGITLVRLTVLLALEVLKPVWRRAVQRNKAALALTSRKPAVH